MVSRRPFITDIDALLKVSMKYEKNLREYQGMQQNDARVAFFKHVNMILDH